jgi:hypothetical protein
MLYGKTFCNKCVKLCIFLWSLCIYYGATFVIRFCNRYSPCHFTVRNERFVLFSYLSERGGIDDIVGAATHCNFVNYKIKKVRDRR